MFLRHKNCRGLGRALLLDIGTLAPLSEVAHAFGHPMGARLVESSHELVTTDQLTRFARAHGTWPAEKCWKRFTAELIESDWIII